MRECGNLRTTFELSDQKRFKQRYAYGRAYEAAKAAANAAGVEMVPYNLYTPISCGWKAYGGWAARDFKLLVVCTQLQLLFSSGGRPCLHIIFVDTAEYLCAPHPASISALQQQP